LLLLRFRVEELAEFDESSSCTVLLRRVIEGLDEVDCLKLARAGFSEVVMLLMELMGCVIDAPQVRFSTFRFSADRDFLALRGWVRFA
jgi:hypothetical protein